MIKDRKVKNIKSTDGIVRRKKTLNFGMVWREWDVSNRVPTIGLILIIFIVVLGFGIVLAAPLVSSKDNSSNFQIKDPYIEVQKTPYPQNLPLSKEENDKEEITGQFKIVDRYLISDIPENEFLDEYSYLKIWLSGFNYFSRGRQASF